MEPGLFKRVTGLEVKDFELLVSLGVFNGSLMTDAIFKFRRYEDASLSYTGINRHEGEDVGGWDTTVKRAEFDKLFVNQQAAMEAPAQEDDDLPDTPYVVEPEDEEDEIDEAPVKKTSARKGKSSEVMVSYIPVEPKRPDMSVVTTHSMYTPPAPKPVEPVRPKVDTSGIKVGVAVTHTKFGSGMIVAIGKDLIAVKFAEGEKRFQFPGAFENGFLSIAK